MAKGKPTLGYPSRTEAVLALRRQQLTTHAIAERIGIQPKTVLSLETSATRSLRRRSQNCRTVVFPIDLLNALGPHAARRGVSANELARRVVEAALDDKLIDAVLDDADDVARYLGSAA
jgi:hypothetical protein